MCSGAWARNIEATDLQNHRFCEQLFVFFADFGLQVIYNL